MIYISIRQLISRSINSPLMIKNTYNVNIHNYIINYIYIYNNIYCEVYRPRRADVTDPLRPQLGLRSRELHGGRALQGLCGEGQAWKQLFSKLSRLKSMDFHLIFS